MAKRRTSILKERQLKLESQLEILGVVGVDIIHKTKDSERKFLDTKFRVEVRLEEVVDLLEAEEDKTAGALRIFDGEKLQDKVDQLKDTVTIKASNPYDHGQPEKEVEKDSGLGRNKVSAIGSAEKKTE